MQWGAVTSEHTAAASFCLVRAERLNPRAGVWQLAAVSAAFRLLHGLAEKSSAYAPIVYKSLIFTLVESAPHSPVRAALMRQMAAALAAHRHLPVAVLLDPLLRQVDDHSNSYPAPPVLRYPVP
jgi:hypothetical protein